MTLLAFDTATRATTVALQRPGEEPAELRDDPPAGARPRHASRLLPLAAELLAGAGLGWADVERLAVGVGPGTFTGLRIGLATARALAQARAISLTGVSTAASLALGAWSHALEAGCQSVAAVIDARRREVFAAAWAIDGALDAADALAEATRPLIVPCALAPVTLAQRLGELGGPTLAVGDGAVEFRPVLERSGALIVGDGSELHRVSAANHCLLAQRLRGGAPADVNPDYLRAPDAQPARLVP